MDKGNIYKKLHNVMQSVGSLEKDEHNDMQNYAYLSESAVKSAIQPLLVEQGIIFQVEVKKTRTRAIYKTKSGNDMYLTKAEIAYSFFDVEDGSSVSGVFEGHGTDTGDKGVYKAVTGAIKYILTSTFLIPTGDDPEKTNGNKKAPTKNVGASYAHTKSTPKVTAKQVKLIQTLCTKTGIEPEKVKERYKVTSMNDLTVSQASEAIDKLNAKLDTA